MKNSWAILIVILVMLTGVLMWTSGFIFHTQTSSVGLNINQATAATIVNGTFGLTWAVPNGYRVTQTISDHRIGAVIDMMNGVNDVSLTIRPMTLATTQPGADQFYSWLLLVKQFSAPVAVNRVDLLGHQGFTSREPTSAGILTQHVYVVGPLYIYEWSSNKLAIDDLETVIKTASVAD